jgi:acyl carrier protein
MAIEVVIERFIVQQIPSVYGLTKIHLDEPLISTGIIDSLMLLQLIDFIEEHFGVSIEDEDIIPENFQTISHIKDLIEKKQ